MIVFRQLRSYISKDSKSINDINVGYHYYKDHRIVSIYCYYKNIIMHLMKPGSTFVVKFRVFNAKYNYITIDFNQFRYEISGKYHYYINYNINRGLCQKE